MSWRIRQRFGGALLIWLVSVFSVCSFSNDTLFSNYTLIEEIPEAFANISKENILWDSLIRDCKNPTFSCIQNSMYQYLDNVLEHTNNYEVGGFLKLTKNNVTLDEQEVNEIDGNDEKNEEKEEEKEEQEESFDRSSPLEEVTSALYEKAVKFIITHDMDVQLPDMLFEGSTLQITPRHFEGSGLVAKLELTPRINEEVETPRIFLKKIKKVIGEKLMHALMAILLVLSLLSVKFMFMTPMIMGVAAAKKMLLKLLLFFFPFLAHLFKLCPYYDPHQGTKFHHHHHQIAHLHHLPQPHIYKHPPFLDHHEHHDHHEHYEHHDPHHDDSEFGLDYNSEGPGFTNEFIVDRKTDHRLGGTKDDNDIYSWIAGQGQDTKRPKKPHMNRPLTPAEIEKLTLKAEKEAVLKVRLQQEHQRVLTENKLLQEQIKQGLKLQEKLRLQASLMQQKRHADAVHLTPGVLGRPVSGRIKPSQVLQTPPVNQAPHLKTSQINSAFSSQISKLHSLQIPHISQALPLQTQIAQALPLQAQMTHALPAQTQKQTFNDALKQAAAITFDPFYSPILEKIDKVLMGIGFIEESCKERLVCSMYKNPTKFSPHSNLVSAQLSRDASELQKPTATNAAVIRFYRYVQAARDGQDKRECLRLYPSCSVNTDL